MFARQVETMLGIEPVTPRDSHQLTKFRVGATKFGPLLAVEPVKVTSFAPACVPLVYRL
jgi:hypothetical protein